MGYRQSTAIGFFGLFILLTVLGISMGGCAGKFSGQLPSPWRGVSSDERFSEKQTRKTAFKIALKKPIAEVTGIDLIQPVNRIQNGSFETGPYPEDGYLTLKAGSTDLPGWTVTRQTVDYLRLDACAHGKRCLDLNGTPGYGEIRQTIETRPGKTYRLSFDLAGNPKGPPAIKTLRVAAAGQSEIFRHTAQPYWTPKIWRFKAVSEKTMLSFLSEDTEGEHFGPLIDNVRVEEALSPESSPDRPQPAVAMVIRYRDRTEQVVPLEKAGIPFGTEGFPSAVSLMFEEP